ncbi:MAG: anaerobic ribonucleoside-triphosphate reductase [Nitrososphaeraceae archaeon]
MLIITGAMERIRYQVKNKSASKRGGILESASRRVRMIFSVMASPNRIDILRILNSQGPLTYSELKSLAGFRSKKESGKFAYHLRKLLRQSLVSLNKAERRYTLTNLGKLVLSLARQIEERSIVESGKLYVRTTKPSIEEFDSNKIIQSLVRESNMPLELAHKITEEVENKIYKIQTPHLTSSLIRETTNSVLIDHGYDEYRTKLARLGVPPSEIINFLSDPNLSIYGISEFFSKISESVFSEHLLNNQLHKDVVDMYLTGEINIENSGYWNILPDTVFLNINSMIDNISNFNGKYLSISKLPSLINNDSFEIVLPVVISMLSQELSKEIVIDGLLDFVNRYSSNMDLANKFYKIFSLISLNISNGSSQPIVTLSITIDNFDPNTIISFLNGYHKYIINTSIPKIGISFVNNSTIDSSYLDLLIAISKHGGLLSFSNKLVRGRHGLCPSADPKINPTIFLQSLSINLPRIAYQSNKDEIYFRARLALLLKPLLSLIYQRKENIFDFIQKDKLPLLNHCTSGMKFGEIESSINLVGLQESIFDILGYSYDIKGKQVMDKSLKTTVDVINEQNKNNNTNSLVGITMLSDVSARRFKQLDVEKYGKSSTYNILNSSDYYYSQGSLLKPNNVFNKDNFDDFLNSCNLFDNTLTNGISVAVDITDLQSNQEIHKLFTTSFDLPNFKISTSVYVCTSCGNRSINPSQKCLSCSSTRIISLDI